MHTEDREYISQVYVSCKIIFYNYVLFYSQTLGVSIFDYKIVHHFLESNLRNARVYFASVYRNVLLDISKYIDVLSHFRIFFQLIKEFIIFAAKCNWYCKIICSTHICRLLHCFSTYLFSVLILATSPVICFNFHTRALRRAALLWS